ncbi:hypothetical protein C8J57DRAFT_625635 [Mycena rebaudengoi]|nr:hypothetical protein C8J57DRAFT_625635 [Mycena rebaudengoi]
MNCQWALKFLMDTCQIEHSHGACCSEPLTKTCMESPFTNMLHTNAIPLDSECQSILDLLERPREEAAGLTQKIAETQALLDRLTAKRDLLNEFIDSHLALVSPARRLPDDIISAIFVACLPPTRNPVISVHVAPLLLCRICRAWRIVALSTPQLWTAIHVVVPSTGNFVAQLNDAVGVWIGRSGSLPLSVSLVSTPLQRRGLSVYSTLNDAIMLLLDTLIRFTHRWRNIRLSLHSQHSFTPLLAVSKDVVPMLQTLVISAGGHEDFSAAEMNWSLLALAGATTLRRVSLMYTAAVLHAPLFCERLRHLSTGRGRRGQTRQFISQPDALELLRRCPNLETCALTLRPLAPPSETLSSAPCYMAHMTDLYIADGSLRETPTEFFHRLVIPGLRALEYEGKYFRGDVLPILPLLSATNRLEHLSIRAGSVPASGLVEGLRLVPTVHTLHIFGEPVRSQESVDRHSPLFQYLLGVDSSEYSSMICPQLRHLKLSHFTDPSDQELLDFIQSRSGLRHDNTTPPAPLSRIDVTFLRPRQLDIIPLLQVFGLQVSLRYRDLPHTSPSDGIEDHGVDWDMPLSGQWETEGDLF